MGRRLTETELEQVAASLREFGYNDVTTEMVTETYEDWLRGETLRHGIVGMFAADQFKSAHEIVGLPDDFRT